MLTVLASTPMLAQGSDGPRPIGFGPIVGMEFNGSTPFLGGAFRMGTPWMLAENPLMFDADFEFYLDQPDGVTSFSIQAAMLLPLILEGSQVKPVVGAGLNYYRASVDAGGFGSISGSNINLALIGGIMVRAFFADLMLRVGDGSGLAARAGFLAVGNIL